MGGFVTALLHNQVLWAAVLSWLFAQLLKTLLAFARDRKLDLGHMVAPGGMPSAHSALVTGLATAVGRLSGVQSTAFALAAVFAGIVMYDAAGVRLAVSRQARILNRMVDDFFHARGFDEHRLRELVGHTPVQVVAGALIGIAFGILVTL
ncbi:MAG TPA: divergent PAP2 family protein [Ktedonobacterales bacterium]